MEESSPNLPQASEPQKQDKKEGFFKKHKGSFYSVALFASAFLTALLLNAFVFQPYEVEGSSMEPTLQNSDRLIVSKTGKTWSRITRSDYLPDRGDIVIFNNGALDKQLIKRVVGLPGDRVVIENGVVTVYNEQNPEGFQPDELVDVDYYKPTQGRVDKTVGESSIYVLGDNRLPNASQDSRSFGTVASEDIIGVLSFRMYPFNKIDSF